MLIGALALCMARHSVDREETCGSRHLAIGVNNVRLGIRDVASCEIWHMVLAAGLHIPRVIGPDPISTVILHSCAERIFPNQPWIHACGHVHWQFRASAACVICTQLSVAVVS